MDGNKDEALRCIGIAKEAIASGNKHRALKFIGIAQRLNHSLAVDDLLAACEDLNSSSSSASGSVKDNRSVINEAGRSKVDGGSNGERMYTEEHVLLVKQIKSKKDYYGVLGLERSCSVEEIRKAYKKLSLKVHPDKNKAPGSEDAFKKVSKAFKCLSEEETRRQYDQNGLDDEFEVSQQTHNTRRRRRRNGYGHDMYEDDFDPDEIFRAFFGQTDFYRTAQVYRSRGGGGGHRREDGVGSNPGPNLLLLLQLVPFLLIILLAYLPFSEPEFSLQKNNTFEYMKVVEKYGIEYFVKSPEFDVNYPVGSPGRANIEHTVIRDYKNMLGRYCHIEMQRRQWSRNYPTPHCDRLQEFGMA